MEFAAELFGAIRIGEKYVHFNFERLPTMEDGVVEVGLPNEVNPSRWTATKTGDREGDFILVVVEVERRLVFEIELAVRDESGIFEGFAIKLRWGIKLLIFEGGLRRRELRKGTKRFRFGTRR